MSRLLKESAVKAYRAREELEKKYGREPTMEEVADETGISREELVMAMEAAADVESFSQTVYTETAVPYSCRTGFPTGRIVMRNY
ncbi:MAG: sigma-70 domain-containing protein [Lachnospiraceae bacterium]|nr:sigma-70 domain-containing protein [Lachnospiraceae bacterium]